MPPSNFSPSDVTEQSIDAITFDSPMPTFSAKIRPSKFVSPALRLRFEARLPIPTMMVRMRTRRLQRQKNSRASELFKPSSKKGNTRGPSKGPRCVSSVVSLESWHIVVFQTVHVSIALPGPYPSWIQHHHSPPNTCGLRNIPPLTHRRPKS